MFKMRSIDNNESVKILIRNSHWEILQIKIFLIKFLDELEYFEFSKRFLFLIKKYLKFLMKNRLASHKNIFFLF